MSHPANLNQNYGLPEGGSWLDDAHLSQADFAQPGWSQTTPRSVYGLEYPGLETDSHDTAIVPAIQGQPMPTMDLNRVATGNGTPIPRPPSLLGPRGGTDLTQNMPQPVSNESPTETLARPSEYRAKHAAGVVATRHRLR